MGNQTHLLTIRSLHNCTGFIEVKMKYVYRLLSRKGVELAGSNIQSSDPVSLTTQPLISYISMYRPNTFENRDQ